LTNEYRKKSILLILI